MHDGSKRAEVSERSAEKRDIQALSEERERAKKLAQSVGMQVWSNSSLSAAMNIIILKIILTVQICDQARELQEALKSTRSELEEFKKRALHAEGIVDECRQEARCGIFIDGDFPCMRVADALKIAMPNQP